jgi:cytoskeleton-associated protein 5
LSGTIVGSSIRELLLTSVFASNFGTQAVPPPSVLKPLPKIFSHSDKTVRAEGTQLTHTLYRFLGSGIESFLSDLKPVQVKELKEAWEVMEKDGKGKGTLKPQRLTRAAAREAVERAETVDAGDGKDDDGEDDAHGSFFSSLRTPTGL